MMLFSFPGPLIIALFSVSGATAAKEDWDDVVVTKVNVLVTLACHDKQLKGKEQLEWLWKPDGQETWHPLLSANQWQELKSRESKAGLRLADSNFRKSGDYSLYFKPRTNDGGRYSCSIAQGGKRKRQKVTLLVILAVSLTPTPPIPKESILRVVTSLSLPEAVSVAWFSPQSLPLRSEVHSPTAVISKLANFTRADEGNYTCQVRPVGKASGLLFLFTYRIAANVYRAAQFAPSQNGYSISRGCVHRTPVSLSCSNVPGDFVVLYWLPPDRGEMSQIFSYDRWRRAEDTRTTARLRLADSAESGFFGFVLEPELGEGGEYRCEVFLNDQVFVQSTDVSVLKVSSWSTPSTLTLLCQYSWRRAVRQVSWTHQNQSRKLVWSSIAPGNIQTEVPLPLGPHEAGIYTCTMQLNHGPVVSAVYSVTPPPTGTPPPTVFSGTSPPSPSILPILSGFGLLVPLVAVAVGVFLWKRVHHNTRPGAQRNLSPCSGEVENVYENPEDLRQTSAQSSVYMDLKPTSDEDVYKELDRYEQCPY